MGSILLLELKEDNRQIAGPLAVLAAEIWTEHYTPIIGTAQVKYMLDKYQSANQILKDIAQNDYRYFIAYDEAEQVGYCAVKPDHTERSLFLSKIYVKKSCRGRGISKIMFSKLISIAKEYRLRDIWLTVNKNNTDSIKIYQRLGFCIVDEMVTDIGNGFVMDDYKMRLLL